MDTTADTNWRQVIQKNYSNLQVKKKSFQDIKKKKSIKKDTRKKNCEQKHKKEIEDAMILDSFNYFLTLPPYSPYSPASGGDKEETRWKRS